MKIFIFFLITLFTLGNCFGQSLIITKFAGNNTAGYSGDGGQALLSQLRQPYGVTSDTMGNVYIADYNNHVIRKVDTAGIITTYAGNGTAGYSGDNGPATLAKLDQPSGLAADKAGNIYIADRYNDVIRKISTSGIITTVAGNGSHGTAGDGGQATAAELSFPLGVAVDKLGNIFIVDNGNMNIRKVSTSGIITRVAGNYGGSYSGDGGPATAAYLNNPQGIAVDTAGNLYIADSYNNVIRKVSTSGIISTIAGNGIGTYAGNGGPATAASLWIPVAVAVDAAANIYIADFQNSTVRKVNSSGTISSFAGTGIGGYSGDGGVATAAKLYLPRSVNIDYSGNLLITDYGNHIIRQMHLNHTPAFAQGTAQGLSVCQNSSSNSINSRLAVYDEDPGQAETLSVVTPPAHGTLGGFPAVSISNGATITPSGLAYAPAVGYIGTDVFTIRVADGFDTAFTTINVTVNALAIAGTLTGPSVVCAGSSITLFASVSGGTWSASNGNASVAGGTVTGITSGTTIISYTASNGCGPVSATKTISVNALANAGTISGASSVCPSGSTTLSSSIAGGTWSAANGNSTITTTGGVMTGVTPGTNIITYRVTNTCGTAITTVNITITTPPVAGTITGLSTVCQGAAITLANSTGGGVWSSGNAGVATVSGGVVTGVGGGTAVISYGVTNACGTAYATKTVTVNAAANPGTLSGASSVCAGASITLTSSVPGGAWSISGSGTIAGGTVTGTTPGTATVSYSVTNGCGTVSALKVVTVESLPTAGTITGPSSVCAGSSITMVGSATGGIWSSSTAAATVSAAGVVTGVSGGSTIVSYTVANSCGTAYATKPVTVNPMPVAGIISGSSTLCTGASIALTVSATGGAWSSSGTNVTINSIGSVTGVTVGTSVISYTVTSGCGTIAATKVVTINTMPVVGVTSGPSAVCVLASITLINTSPGGTWSSSNTSVASVSGGTVTGVAAGTAAITYRITNSCGTAMVANTVAVNPLPIAGVLTGPSSVCAGAFITLTASAGGGVWSSTPFVSVAAGTVTGITAGTAIVSYSVVNGCGTTVATKNITVDSAPFAGAISGSSAVCQGAFATLTTTGLGGIWTSSSTAASITGGGVVTGVIAGTTTISYTVANACNTVLATKIITVNPAPVAGTISGPSAVCTGASIVLTATAAGGTWATTGSVASVSGGTVTGIATGTATISYTVTNGCGNISATKVVTVGGIPATGIISGPSMVCVGATATLVSSVAGGVWSSGAPAATIGSVTSTSGVLVGVSAGTSLISYTISNTCGTSVATYSITVNPIPNVTPLASQVLCAGDVTTAVTFAGMVSGTTYTWTNSSAGIGLAPVGTGDIASFTTTNTGIMPLVATIIVTPAAGGCTGTAQSFNITVKPVPVMVPLTDQTVCNGSSAAAVTFSSAVSSTTYTWVNDNTTIGLGATGTGNIASFTAINTSTVAAVAVITVTPAANGCTGTAEDLAITIHPTPVVTMPSDISVCAGTMISAIAFPATVSGTVCNWVNSNTGIGLAGTGTGNIAPFTTLNSGTVAITATISVTPAANGCTGAVASFEITVVPVPATPIIDTKPLAELCANTQFQNFGAAATAPTGMLYSWSATNATIYAGGAGKQYSLVSFPNEGQSEVTLAVTDLSGGCASHTSYIVNVGASVSAVPSVIYYGGQFICLQYSAGGYVWGYDDALTLDSTIITGEINQSYYNELPDTAHRHYWVMTNNDGCGQKAYYGPLPAGINEPVKQSGNGIMLYPNPAGNVLNIVLEGDLQTKTEVQIFEPSGRQVSSAMLNNNKGTIDVSRLAQGFYIIYCYRNGQRITTTFIKS